MHSTIRACDGNADGRVCHPLCYCHVNYTSVCTSHDSTKVKRNEQVLGTTEKRWCAFIAVMAIKGPINVTPPFIYIIAAKPVHVILTFEDGGRKGRDD